MDRSDVVATAARPGLCSITLRHEPWEQVVEVAAAAGLAGIEWGGDGHVRPGDGARAMAVAERCRAAGLVCPSYGSYLRAGDVSAGAAGADEVAAVLDAAQVLGATNVRVWCRWLAVADATEADRAAVAADLTAVCSAAADRALTVSLEHHRFTLTETVASTRTLLADVDAPNLFTYWQPCDDLAGSDLLAEVRALRHDLSHLHVFRWRSFDDRLALVDGADLWPAVLDLATTSTGRWSGDRWAFLEYVRHDDPAQVAVDAAVLVRWLQEARPDR